MPKAKPLKAGMTEAQVLAGVLDAARMLGLDVQRQNTGAGVNPRGKVVRFGTPGDSDVRGVLPGGRTLHVEVKREGFDPGKLRGAKREHFDRQLARLRKTNELGGVGFWTDCPLTFLKVMRAVLDGAKVVEAGYGPLEIHPKETRRADPS